MAFIPPPPHWIGPPPNDRRPPGDVWIQGGPSSVPPWLSALRAIWNFNGGTGQQMPGLRQGPLPPVPGQGSRLFNGGVGAFGSGPPPPRWIGPPPRFGGPLPPGPPPPIVQSGYDPRRNSGAH